MNGFILELYSRFLKKYYADNSCFLKLHAAKCMRLCHTSVYKEPVTPLANEKHYLFQKKYIEQIHQIAFSRKTYKKLHFHFFQNITLISHISEIYMLLAVFKR